MAPSSVTLASGLDMPTVGLGTFRLSGQEAYHAVLFALKCGYRLIDTASIYKNHEDVGQAIKDSGVPREEIFITSKVSPYEQGSEKATAAVKEFLTQLGVDYIDQILIHWPGVSRVAHNSPRHATERLSTWEGLSQLKSEGLIKSLGVSNFEIHHLEHLLTNAQEGPDVNQVELHPRYQQKKLRDYCKEHKIQIVAYSSLGSGNLMIHEGIMRIAKGEDPAPMLLKWALEQDLVVLPKSSKRERIKATAPTQLLTSDPLPEQIVKLLDAMDDGTKYCWNPQGIDY